MPDDRPNEDPTTLAAKVATDLEDLRTQVAMLQGRRPTGDIEPTLRTTPKADTVLLNGQTLSRATYPRLWQWAQDNGLVIANLFGAGDGSTTFTVPDMEGRYPLMAGTLANPVGGTDTYTVGQVIGSSTVKLATDHMPAHSHYVVVNTYQHFHAVDVASVGNHGAHRPGISPGVGGAGASWPNVANGDFGGHWHGASTHNNDHWHEGRTEVIGGSDGNNQATGRLENRPPSLVINWLIWT